MGFEYTAVPRRLSRARGGMRPERVREGCMTGTGGEFGGTVALRGGLVSFQGDPFLVAPAEALRYEPDALVWCENGRIRAAGPWSALASGLPRGVPLHEYPGHVLCAGFVD